MENLDVSCGGRNPRPAVESVELATGIRLECVEQRFPEGGERWLTSEVDRMSYGAPRRCVPVTSGSSIARYVETVGTQEPLRIITSTTSYAWPEPCSSCGDKSLRLYRVWQPFCDYYGAEECPWAGHWDHCSCGGGRGNNETLAEGLCLTCVQTLFPGDEGRWVSIPV